MNSMLIVGVIIIVGFILGEMAKKANLPKVTGYIVAGILLNPRIVSFIPTSFVEHTEVVTNLSLSVITFSVGGTLLLSRIRNLGKRILKITLFESGIAFSMVIIGFIIISPFFLDIEQATYMTVFVPFSLLLGSLAAPTDPTATLAIAHEYNAKGNVMSTIMGVAAFDDAMGIVLYSIAVALAGSFISPEHVGFSAVALNIIREIFGALALGAFMGFVFNKFTDMMKIRSEGMFIVIIIGLLAVCFGIAELLSVDELLVAMFMGFIVVNFNKQSEFIFKIIERYTEQLIFVLFFTISGMHLDVTVLADYSMLVLFFILFRAIGKYTGTRIGAGKSPAEVKKYTAGGLIPQGGIVIGLALMINQNPDFSSIVDPFINIILGATVIHELIGPVVAKFSLRRAGEIDSQ